VSSNKVGQLSHVEGAFGASYVTGHLLRQREWQQRALEVAEQERMLRAAGLEPGGVLPAFGALRPKALLGGVMTWIGRLQSASARGIRPASELS
jgi:hypothetical protein